jgi:hypothetical protein
MGAGIITKVLIGAVAVAAVGAATLPLAQPGEPTPDSSSVVTVATDTESTSVDETAGKPAAVEVFVDDVHAWTDCIKAAVDEHVANREESRGGFDPHGACGELPKYVGRDGVLPAQASEKANENRDKDKEAKGEANGAADADPAGSAEKAKGGNGNGNGKPPDNAP